MASILLGTACHFCFAWTLAFFTVWDIFHGYVLLQDIVLEFSTRSLRVNTNVHRVMQQQNVIHDLNEWCGVCLSMLSIGFLAVSISGFP